ncbi:molybdate ABC transporter substrate-binding protein [Sandarakinorhabdus sp. DWP1-3-1]|uniref:molybdate ABC transporter substrate-binding protein n=1 Tax=Sandarakinorhabdus sp. DWP1-3-1 TaxID=2804627 RepID=UPI003CF0099E
MLARLIALLLLFVPGIAGAAPLRVLAASSMTEAMEAIADAWAAAGHPRPVLVLAGSPALARQVIAGAPAGVLVTADTEWMDAAAAAGAIVAGSRRNVAGNRLVLVVPARAPRSARLVRGFDLAAFVGPGRWTTGDPQSVPVGRYARAALAGLGAWDQAAPRLASAENVRAALAFVERGDAAAGIVYASDARASRRVAVAGVFPAASHPPIVYPAALVAAGADAEARGFLAFLSGPRARAIFKSRGFTTP